MRRRRQVALVGAPLVLAAGCAERGVTSGPPGSTGTGTWVAVVVAGVLAVVVLAALLLAPGWRRGGSVFAAGVLALQAAGAAVGGAILIGVAVRGEQLLGRPDDAEQAASLVRLTGLDGGDAGFFRLMVGVTVVLGALVIVVLALAARFAADVDPTERFLASALLALECAMSAVCGVLVLLGDGSRPVTIPAAALPVLVLALVTCWPRQTSAPVPDPAPT